ncbi:MAG: beta-propeller domain-containing protein [Deltaproteobacteria bacterium]|nr:beta-propeller domain-containing protein [Deltaproteobacteria bacterium]
MERVQKQMFALLGLATAMGFVVGCADMGLGEDVIEGDPVVTDDEFTKADHFTSRSAGPTGRWRGQSDFVSAAPFRYSPFLRTTAAEGADATAKTAERKVEESDIYKLDGNRLYILNSYRGLHTVDVSSPAAPRLLGRKAIYGMPSEMYVRSGYAFVLANDWQGLNADGNDLNQGAQLRAYDVRGSRPAEVGAFDIAGYVVGSRLVGNVLYIVSSHWAWDAATNQSTERMFVQSINIANPAAPRSVEREEWKGSGWTVAVSPDYMFIANGEWTANASKTKIRVVDIKDPNGRITIGGTLTVDGNLWQEARMDFFAGHLRVVTQGWDRGGWAKLSVAKMSATRTLSVVGTLDLGNIGTLTGAKYDGEKGYLVHGQQVDPLDVIDLSNPARPTLVSRLEIPGFFDHLVARGDRVLAVGREQVDGKWKIAVALFDVSNAAAPRELSRVNLGEDWSWTHNESGKMKEMSILDNLGLVVLPYTTYNYDGDQMWGAATSRLQLLGLTRTALTKLGSVSSADFADRSFTLGSNLGAISYRRLASYSIADRNRPTLAGELELSRNVAQVARTAANVVELVGDYSEALELRVKPTQNADDSAPLGRVTLTGEGGSLYTNGSFVYVVANSWKSGEQKTLVHVVSTLPASNPRLQGTLELTGVSQGRWGGPIIMSRIACIGGRCPWFRNVVKPVQVDGNMLVFHGNKAKTDGTSDEVLFVVDLADPRTPKLAATPKLDLGTVASLHATGRKVHVSTHAPFEIDAACNATTSTDPTDPDARPVPSSCGQTVKFFATTFNLDRPAQPVQGAKVNVPGPVVDAWSSTSGQTSYLATTDSRYRKEKTALKSFDTLKLRSDGKAQLLDLRLIDDSADELKLAGRHVYYTETKWPETWTPTSKPTVKFRTLSYTNPLAIRLTNTKTFSSYRSVADVQGGFAFLTREGNNLDAYSLAYADVPSFKKSTRLFGWSTQLAVGSDKVAFVAEGNFGLTEISLR